MKILLVEDELQLSKTLLKFLKNEGFLVDTAFDFPQALFKIADNVYDCILIDITLPKGNGLELIKQLKADHSKSGIIIISAKNSDDDKILGLDLGADDYLSKPFNFSELNSRIRALLRRRNFDGENILQINELIIKPNEHCVFVNGEEVVLTKKEFDLLLFLVTNKNRVVSKLSIAEHLSIDDEDQLFNHDFIYVHLRNLRKKLSDKGCIDYIQTIYGIGYKFNTSL
jgi:DNA-binding response OmpR family regulator